MADMPEGTTDFKKGYRSMGHTGYGQDYYVLTPKNMTFTVQPECDDPVKAIEDAVARGELPPAAAAWARARQAAMPTIRCPIGRKVL